MLFRTRHGAERRITKSSKLRQSYLTRYSLGLRRTLAVFTVATHLTPPNRLGRRCEARYTHPVARYSETYSRLGIDRNYPVYPVDAGVPYMYELVAYQLNAEYCIVCEPKTSPEQNMKKLWSTWCTYLGKRS